MVFIRYQKGLGSRNFISINRLNHKRQIAGETLTQRIYNLGEMTWEMAESFGYQKISLAESHQASLILSSPLITLQPGDKNRLPFFCMHPIGGNVFWYMDLARYLGAEQPFYGLQSAGLYGEREPLTRIEDMADRKSVV